METLIEYQCDCDTCKNFCFTPCWGTPDEIDKIIRHLEELENITAIEAIETYFAIENYYLPDLETVHVLAPKRNSGGRCVFQDKNLLCSLHNCGLKPIEGRVVDHDNPAMDECGEPVDIRQTIALIWYDNKPLQEALTR